MSRHISLLLASTLLANTYLLAPSPARPQVDPGNMPLRIFEILSAQGIRLGRILVVSEDGGRYEAGNEYWHFDETALQTIAEQPHLRFAPWFEGDWHHPTALDALRWRVDGPAVEWSHPARVEWTDSEIQTPSINPGSVYFGDPSVGGVAIHFNSRGFSSLTWFNHTGGDFVLFAEGGVLERQAEIPSTGSWWLGLLQLRHR